MYPLSDVHSHVATFEVYVVRVVGIYDAKITVSVSRIDIYPIQLHNKTLFYGFFLSLCNYFGIYLIMKPKLISWEICSLCAKIWEMWEN